jgi:hypothetical protein
VRLHHAYGGVTLSNVFHVADLGAAGSVNDFSAIAEALLRAWTLGFGGYPAPATWQGAGVVLSHARVIFVNPLTGLHGFGVEPIGVIGLPGGPLPPLPSNVSVSVGLNCELGGHSGRGWHFYPWLSESALSPGSADKLAAGVGSGLVRSYLGLRAALAAAADPLRYRLVVYHRNGRNEPGAVRPVWWDDVADFQVRGSGLAELRVRLPGHGRR